MKRALRAHLKAMLRSEAKENGDDLVEMFLDDVSFYKYARSMICSLEQSGLDLWETAAAYFRDNWLSKKCTWFHCEVTIGPSGIQAFLRS